MPVLLNRDQQPYTNSDAFRYLQMLRNGAFNAVAHTPKFSTTHGQKGLKPEQPQKSIAQVLKQKLELSTSIKQSYDEHTRRDGTQDALFELGRYVAFKTGAIFVPGPLKGVDGVIRKTMHFPDRSQPEGRGYEGNYAMMKDEVRLTLVGDDSKTYAAACDLMRAVCNSANGMSFMKNSTRDPNQDPCGYSDTNMVVKLPNTEPGEVQINNRAVLYGKMSARSFCGQLGVDDAEYTRLGMSYGVEGGLGHAFYEVYRAGTTNQNGKLAAELSKRYYGVLRSYPHINGAERTKLIEEITRFKAVPANAPIFSHA